MQPNTFVKVDTQIEENCRRTISYLQEQGIHAQSFSCKKLSNLKPTMNTVRNTRGKTLRKIRGKIKELLFIKVTVYLPFSFQTYLNKVKYGIYSEFYGYN